MESVLSRLSSRTSQNLEILGEVLTLACKQSRNPKLLKTHPRMMSLLSGWRRNNLLPLN